MKIFKNLLEENPDYREYINLLECNIEQRENDNIILSAVDYRESLNKLYRYKAKVDLELKKISNMPNELKINDVLKYEKTLSKDEIKAYAKEWNDLVEINSELRVLENEKVKNKKYSDYYDIILNILKEIAPCKISILIAECMGKEVLNDAGDLVYLTLIDQLINLKKIKIVKKGTRHFVDTIDLSKN